VRLNTAKITVCVYNNGCDIIPYIFMILPHAFSGIKYSENIEIIAYVQLIAVVVQRLMSCMQLHDVCICGAVT
jgi:hypothetical protein